MLKAVQMIGAIGFILCLILMNRMEHRVKAVEPSFRTLDMRFHYSSEEMETTISDIKEEGRRAYGWFLSIDYGFIACFLIVMLTVSGAVFTLPIIRNVFFAVCVCRAVFDIVENTMLLTLLRAYPSFYQPLGAVCPWVTTLKFIMLYAWLLAVVIQLVVHGLHITRPA